MYSVDYGMIVEFKFLGLSVGREIWWAVGGEMPYSVDGEMLLSVGG